MSHWKEYKLGEITDINKKSVGKGYSFEIIEYVDTSSVTENKFDNPQIIPLVEAPSRAKRLVDEGDTIISTVRPIQKHYGFIKNSKPNTVVSTGFAVVSPKKIDPKFLYYFLTQEEITVYLNTLAESGTTTFPAFRPEELAKLTIWAPESIEEQTAIASILSSLDQKIELNNAINRNLEALAQALFKQWFVEFEFPVDQNGNFSPLTGEMSQGQRGYKSSGGEMVESELGMIPKGWRVGSIYEASDVIYGAPFKSSLFNQEKKGYPLIRIRDLKTYAPQFWTEENHPKGVIIRAGELVVGMDAEFRPHIWLGEEAYLNQRLCHFKPKGYFTRLFVCETIRPQLMFHENSSVGTTVIHLGKKEIDSFKTLIPPNNIIHGFGETTEPILEQIVNNSKENRNLKSLRDTLLPKLISGELEVKDV